MNATRLRNAADIPTPFGELLRDSEYVDDPGAKRNDRQLRHADKVQFGNSTDSRYIFSPRLHHASRQGEIARLAEVMQNGPRRRDCSTRSRSRQRWRVVFSFRPIVELGRLIFTELGARIKHY